MASDTFDNQLQSPQRWRPLSAPVVNLPGFRSRDALLAVLRQFSVATSERYRPGPAGSGITWCNIFVADATKALGCEIPHWVRKDGSAARMGEQGAAEMTANGIVEWLEVFGPVLGWQEVNAAHGQDLANQGYPVVGVWKNAPGKHGHVAMCRPGVAGAGGPRVCQAGARCGEDFSAAEVFGSRVVRWFAHE